MIGLLRAYSLMKDFTKNKVHATDEMIATAQNILEMEILVKI